MHVNWYEADAYCRWAGRRLPTEAEWELAASSHHITSRARQEMGTSSEGRPTRRLVHGRGSLHDRFAGAGKPRFPWGDDPPTPQRANLDWCYGGLVEVESLAAGASAFGCRQMIGNVWEWTASDFLPYPGFVPDPYKEFSQPWFGNRKVLRGGCWATRSRLMRNSLRNYYTPERRDVFAGFRTCACDD